MYAQKYAFMCVRRGVTMLKRKLGMLLAVVVLATGIGVSGLDYAGSGTSIDGDKIILAEPLSERVRSDEPIYVTVNITDPAIKASPLTVSLVRIEQHMPFAKQMGKGLKVSVVKLTRPSYADDLAFLRTYGAASCSEQYRDEIALINRYFEVRDQMRSLTRQAAALNVDGGFDKLSGTDSALSDLSESQRQAYKRWLRLKGRLSDLELEERGLACVYAGYFETPVFSDTIDGLSYFNNIGTLQAGTYRLRFLDASGKLVKEYHLHSVSDDSVLILERNEVLINP